MTYSDAMILLLWEYRCMCGVFFFSIYNESTQLTFHFLSIWNAPTTRWWFIKRIKWFADGTGKCSTLDWAARYKIIKGICCGLRYLHEECEKQTLHLDIKPSNILLDDAMNPKISDFGMSRLFDRGSTHNMSKFYAPVYVPDHLLSLICIDINLEWADHILSSIRATEFTVLLRTSYDAGDIAHRSMPTVGKFRQRRISSALAFCCWR